MRAKPLSLVFCYFTISSYEDFDFTEYEGKQEALPSSIEMTNGGEKRSSI